MKNTMVKRLLAVVMAVGMMFSAAACGTSESSSPAAQPEETTGETTEPADSGESVSYKVGIIPQSLNDPFQVILGNVAKSYLEERGCECTVMGGTTYADVNSQIEYIENMVANDYDAILVSPMEGSAGICSIIADAIEKGVVVVNFDNSISDAVMEEVGLDFNAFPRVGTDNYAASALAAEWAMDNYPEGTKVALVQGTDGSECNNLRTNGFLDTVGDYFEIVAQQNADWEVEKAYTATQNMITGHPDIELMYCMSDNMAIGCSNALEEAGNTDVDVIGFDGTPDGIQAVIDGKLVMELGQDVVCISETASQLALDMLGGAEGVSTSIDGLVVLKDDAAAKREAIVKYLD